MILFAKIVAIFLAGTVISKTYLDWKKHRESFATLSFWTLAWLGVVYAAFDPSVFIKITDKIGEKGAGFGTLFGLAFIFLFFITYRVYIKANRLEQQIKDIVMKLGLRDIKNE